VTEFRIGERVRIVRSLDAQRNQTGVISGVQPTDQLKDRSGEMAVSEAHRGYIVTMDAGNTRFLMGMDFEAQ